MRKVVAAALLAGLAFTGIAPAQTKLETTVKGEGALVWGIDLVTLASGFTNEFVSELKLDLVKPTTVTGKGKTPVFGTIELKDFQFSIAQDGSTLAGWDSNVPLPSGTGMATGGFVFVPPTVTGRINTTVATLPVWLELAAGRPGKPGDVWVLDYAQPYAASDTYAGPEASWSGAAVSLDTALKDYYERWDVLLNLGNGPSERHTQQGWSTGGFNLGLGVWDTTLHFSSLGDWKSRTISWLDSNGVTQSRDVAPNLQGAYSLGGEVKIPVLPGLELDAGGGLAMLSLGTFALDKAGISVRPSLKLALGKSSLVTSLGADAILPQGDAAKTLYDVSFAAKLLPVEGAAVAFDAYWRDDLSNHPARLESMKTLNSKLTVSDASGNAGLIPLVGLTASAGLYDVLGTNQQSFFYDEATGKGAATWDLQVKADVQVGDYLVPYGSVVLGSTRKAYSNATFDSLGNYYGGQSIPAAIKGAADTWNKIAYDVGFRVVNLIDLATIDVHYSSAGVVTIDTRVAY